VLRKKRCILVVRAVGCAVEVGGDGGVEDLGMLDVEDGDEKPNSMCRG